MLIVEDGSGLIDSNSYASVNEFKAYHNSVGNDISALTDDRIEQLLISATEFIDTAYEFLGQRLTIEQALEFPRYGTQFFPISGNYFLLIHPRLKKACCSQAYAILSNPQFSSDRSVKSERVKVDVIETETEYDNPVTELDKYPQTNMLLSKFIEHGRAFF